MQNPCNTPNFVPLAITQHFDIQGANDAIETYNFIDGLGRVIQVKKDIVVNTAVNHTVPPAFVQGMSVSGWTSYDEFGRKTDQYNAGGNIYSIVNNDSYAYVSRSDYNYFGELAYQKYGNNTETVYAYTDKLRRLNSINVNNSSAQILMSPVYSYDYIGNITAISNQGTTIGSFSMNNARYDSYNRFTGATGSFNDPVTNKSSTYNLSGMVYGSSGEILEKNQSHILQGNSNPLNTYNNQYDYISSSHKISQIKDLISGRTEQFSYDLNGNVAQRVIPTLEYNYGWDEENRLRTFTKKDKLGETTHLYYYDALGERIIKIKGTTAKLFQDAELSSAQLLLRDFTVYPSAFLTQSDTKITKHYYAGTKRIASRIEMKTASEPNTGVDTELQLKQESDLMEIVKKLDCKEYKYEFNQFEAEVEDDDTIALMAEVPSPVFFYHPDHLGTSTIISNSAGAVHQYFFNLPFGETMIEGCTNTSYELSYKFNAKELDAESGLYYYGARYYDPRISVWMSVDPMADRYPSWSPYNYIYDNPTNGIDPDGRDGILIVFPNYKIDTETRLGKQPLGHAGVLLIDNKTGYTKYYEYGRYKTDDGTRGKVRTIAVPNVVIGADGKPTQESLNKVLVRISEKAGQGGKIEGSYVQGDFTKMNEYAQEKLKESNPQYKEYAKDRKPYSLTGNNCATFASDVLKQDAEAKKRAPWILNPTPKNIGKEYQDNFPEVNYNPKTKTTTSDIYKKNKK